MIIIYNQTFFFKKINSCRLSVIKIDIFAVVKQQVNAIILLLVFLIVLLHELIPHHHHHDLHRNEVVNLHDIKNYAEDDDSAHHHHQGEEHHHHSTPEPDDNQKKNFPFHHHLYVDDYFGYIRLNAKDYRPIVTETFTITCLFNCLLPEEFPTGITVAFPSDDTFCIKSISMLGASGLRSPPYLV